MTDPMPVKIAKAIADDSLLRGLHTGRQKLIDELIPVIAVAMGGAPKRANKFKVGDQVARDGMAGEVTHVRDRGPRWRVAWPTGIEWENTEALRLNTSRYHAEVPPPVFEQVVLDMAALAQDGIELVGAQMKIRAALRKSLTPRHEGPDPALLEALSAIRGAGTDLSADVRSEDAWGSLWRYIVRLQDAVLAADDSEAVFVSSQVVAAANEICLIEEANE